MLRVLFIIFISIVVYDHLSSQEGHIVIEKKTPIQEEMRKDDNYKDEKEETKRVNKEEKFKEEFRKDTKEWQIKIYIAYILFFISLIYVIREFKRKKIYK
ncbi:MAG TPA: hypothetical protein PKW55_07830 [Spirochaetota bacterium]|nr:hypothetical protein [Spirochaetota bacterium]HOM38695.1 hypothetical protein [Spirochaetota bacterium]HPQ49789.1 hypothetical protein [Spirochaetota bacterium]